MVKIIRTFSIVFLVSAISLVASANSQLRYFEASVPVKSQDSKERLRAAKEAFLQVIYRISGSEAVLLDPTIQDKANNALSYIQQYQYENLSDSALADEGYSEQLSLNFSPIVIRKILSQAQQPYWSENRPTTLVWLVEDHPEEGKRLLNQYSDTPVIASLTSASERRGLPLVYPLLDLDDQIVLDVEDVWYLNEDKIREASERYSADVIMVGRFSQTSRGELWSIWQYIHAGVSQSYDSRLQLEDENLSELLGREALDPLADFLAGRYALLPKLEDSGSLVMKVSGIRGYGDYRLSLNYLQGLAAVSKVQVSAVRGDTLLIYLDSEASIEQFMGVLALDDKLKPQEDTVPIGPVWQQAPSGTVDNPLSFVWSS